MAGAWDPVLIVRREIEHGRGRGLKSNARHVSRVIADHMTGELPAFPSVERIAGLCGLGLTATRTAIRQACEGPSALFVREIGGPDSSRKGYRVSSYSLRPDLPPLLRLTREGLPRQAIAPPSPRDRGLPRHAVKKEPMKEPMKEGALRTAAEVEREEDRRFLESIGKRKP